MARNGTLFLDEIGELYLSMQAKLLRVLQEKEYIPVGGSQVQTTNARVIAATNVDLREAVARDSFREDLFYRLQVVTIHMPPLRERRGDLPALMQALLARINREMHHKVTRVSLDVMDAFHRYHWPGNIRELENVLMKAVALCPGDTLTRDLLPQALQAVTTATPQDARPAGELSLRDVERAHILRVLESTDWHRGHTCEILGISRPRLRRLIRQYELSVPEGNGDEEDNMGEDDP